MSERDVQTGQPDEPTAEATPSEAATSETTNSDTRARRSNNPRVHREDLEVLEERLGYVFKDRTLLVQALTHRSYVNECEEDAVDNQRLEFLGDAVLGLVSAEALFRRDAQAPEGTLSSRQSQLVCESALAEVANGVELGHFIRLGKGEVQTGGRHKHSLLADAYEAVLAAIYLDGGLEAAREVVLRLHAAALEGVQADTKQPVAATDAKSLLQKAVQAETSMRPVYAVVEESGPAHARTFVSEARIGSKVWGRGEGRSKKVAEQEAAAQALSRWHARNAPPE